MERGGIGVLVLKTAGIGNQATQQAGRNAITCDNAAIVQETVDDHGAGRGIDAPQAQLGKLLARRMMIEAHHMLGATKHLGGIIEALDDRYVHRDEQVRIAGVRRCRHQAVGAFHKAVNARNRVIVCQQQRNVLVGENFMSERPRPNTEPRASPSGEVCPEIAMEDAPSMSSRMRR